MATVLEMAEAHLLNVQREINSLKERRVSLDAEIERLQSFFDEGVKVLTEAKNPVVSETSEAPPPRRAPTRDLKQEVESDPFKKLSF